MLVPLDEEAVRGAVRELVDEGMTAIAVSFLWSVRNPAHEHRARDIALEVEPGLFVTCGADLVSSVGEYERTTTCVMNAFIGPLMADYVDAILEEAAARLGYRDRCCSRSARAGRSPARRCARRRSARSTPVPSRAC